MTRGDVVALIVSRSETIVIDWFVSCGCSNLDFGFQHNNRGASLKRLLIGALFLVAVSATSLSMDGDSVAGQAMDFQLTVRNITERQPISPPIVVVHDVSAVLLPSTAGRLEGLEAFAESGSQPELMESLSGRSGVKDVLRFGGVLSPNSQQTLLRVSASPGDRISVLGSLQCTNDAITLGTVIVSDDGSPSFGSGAVWDAGTEDNEESRATVPCLDGDGVSNLDTADGEGSIVRHRGISGNVDLGTVFGWHHTVMEISLDQRGANPRRAFEVGATLENRTTGQPITPPVVVVHDKKVDVLEYTRPRELLGIDALSESGDGTVLLSTLSEMPGVVSVRQWQTDGPIAPGSSFSGNARAFSGNVVTVLGMFTCTNDGYIAASAEVKGASISIEGTSVVAKVFDSGSENNWETAATVPCLGGDSAGISEGTGENGRQEHPGIAGIRDLSVDLHGWTSDRTALLSLHAAVDEAPRPEPTVVPVPVDTPVPEPTEIPIEEPDTGGSAPTSIWVYVALVVGVGLMVSGRVMWRSANRRPRRQE